MNFQLQKAPHRSAPRAFARQRVKIQWLGIIKANGWGFHQPKLNLWPVAGYFLLLAVFVLKFYTAQKAARDDAGASWFARRDDDDDNGRTERKKMQITRRPSRTMRTARNSSHHAPLASYRNESSDKFHCRGWWIVNLDEAQKLLFIHPTTSPRRLDWPEREWNERLIEIYFHHVALIRLIFINKTVTLVFHFRCFSLLSLSCFA